MICLSESQERSGTSGIIVRYHVKEKTDSDKMPSGEVVLDKKSSSEEEEEEKLMLIKRPTKPLSDESEEQETDVRKCTIMLVLEAFQKFSKIQLKITCFAVIELFCNISFCMYSLLRMIKKGLELPHLKKDQH